ncbi:unnamed protein product [Prorocentrum cordatum]|uniref:Uncharacterized protein n=1 Tax=Prorocentrum cordatum TaxID=2364126 RepID=A0ABN9QVD4_9DINO|nr:unnamed protein product [Polarella glacialis]
MPRWPRRLCTDGGRLTPELYCAGILRGTAAPPTEFEPDGADLELHGVCSRIPRSLCSSPGQHSVFLEWGIRQLRHVSDSACEHRRPKHLPTAPRVRQQRQSCHTSLGSTVLSTTPADKAMCWGAAAFSLLCRTRSRQRAAAPPRITAEIY